MQEIICFVCSMEKLSGNILSKSVQGEHVMRHQKGLWNRMWSNMMIDTTYMKYRKGHWGMIGITTKPCSLQIWANSYHVL